MEKELKMSKNLKDIDNYFITFVEFLKIVIYLQNALDCHGKRDGCLDEEILEFCCEECADSANFDDIKTEIKDTEIKSNRKSKTSRFTLQTYAFAYYKIIDFPPNIKYGNSVLITQDFFENIQRIINVKIHPHHSDATGEILGYALGFCNLKVGENQSSFSCWAYTFFKFDMFFLLKGIRFSVWNTKDLNIGENGLINFASLRSRVKFVDSVKCFLTRLGKLASSLDETEKKNVEKTTTQFLLYHPYFSEVCSRLSVRKKEKILDIIVSRKGVIPYKKISSIHSFKLKPEDGVSFTRDEFYGTLKGKAVGEEEYENSKILYTELKMWDMSDLIDLYNAQDLIWLCESFENLFQIMYEKNMYNPRKIN